MAALARAALALVNARVFALGALLRVALVAFSLWADARLPVRFTDADYFVFRDAAAAVARGGSPYARATYRYPPLVALLLAPGEALGLGAVWGKALFCAADVACGALVVAAARAGGAPRAAARRAAALHLLSPFAAVLAARGSADALGGALLLAALAAAAARRPGAAGAALGLAAHARLYPALLALPLALALRGRGPRARRVACGLCHARVRRAAAAAAATFFAAGAAGVAAYGADAVDEAYLFHAARVDARHNFAVAWHATYLTGRGVAGGGAVAAVASVLGGALAARGDLPLAAAVAVWALVAGNGVVTAQYFGWWQALLPLAAVRSRARAPAAAAAAAAWLAAEAHWLRWAYALEHRGEAVHDRLAAAAALFFAVNVAAAAALVAAHDWAAADAEAARVAAADASDEAAEDAAAKVKAA
jgi:phosphatidylinositol glycan class M